MSNIIINLCELKKDKKYENINRKEVRIDKTHYFLYDYDAIIHIKEFHHFCELLVKSVTKKINKLENWVISNYI